MNQLVRLNPERATRPAFGFFDFCGALSVVGGVVLFLSRGLVLEVLSQRETQDAYIFFARVTARKCAKNTAKVYLGTADGQTVLKCRCNRGFWFESKTEKSTEKIEAEEDAEDEEDDPGSSTHDIHDGISNAVRMKHERGDRGLRW